MGCDYYVFKYLIVSYTFKGELFEIKIKWSMSNGYFYEYTEEEKERILQSEVTKPYKLVEYEFDAIKKHILQLHDFTDLDDNFIPDVCEVTEQDVESYNKITRLIGGNLITHSQITNRLNGLNKTKLINFNYLKNVKIINTELETRKQLRT